jgi:hypothetical protein
LRTLISFLFLINLADYEIHKIEKSSDLSICSFRENPPEITEPKINGAEFVSVKFKSIFTVNFWMKIGSIISISPLFGPF